MKYYAVATDTVRDEPFGIVVKNGSSSVCYGLHAAGTEWADLYNAGEVKTLEEGLPPDVELGHFGRLRFDIEEVLEQSPETIPPPAMLSLVESEWLDNNSTGIGLTHVPLAGVSKKSRQLAIDYKAHAFLADSHHSSLLLKARLSGTYLAPDDSRTRRTAKELLKTKILILTQPYRNEDAISEEEMETKALGRAIGHGARRARRIGRAAGRSAAGFDPHARDADLDMLVQEGTAWERPALPDKPDLPGTTRRTPADRDRSARRMREGLRSGRSDMYYQPDDDPATERDIERGIERFEKDILDQTVGKVYDEFGIRDLEPIFRRYDDDDDERERLMDQTLIRDLPEELRNEVEGILHNYAVDSPEDMLEYLDASVARPDPYDVARDREMDDRERDGLRSFREFSRRARRDAPHDSPEGRRARREDKEEYDRLVQFIMDDSQRRHDVYARLNPDKNPEDFHDYYRVRSREEAVEELRELGNNARVLGTGPGSPLGELRQRAAEAHRSRFGADGLRSRRSWLGTDINPAWDIRDPADRNDWHESEMGPGQDAVGKISTDNVNVEIVSEADVMGEGGGFMVSGYYRDIDGVSGNESEWLYDLDVFTTPEEAAAWVDSLDRSIDNDVGYDDWDPPKKIMDMASDTSGWGLLQAGEEDHWGGFVPGLLKRRYDEGRYGDVPLSAYPGLRSRRRGPGINDVPDMPELDNDLLDSLDEEDIPDPDLLKDHIKKVMDYADEIDSIMSEAMRERAGQNKRLEGMGLTRQDVREWPNPRTRGILGEGPPRRISDVIADDMISDFYGSDFKKRNWVENPDGPDDVVHIIDSETLDWDEMDDRWDELVDVPFGELIHESGYTHKEIRDLIDEVEKHNDDMGWEEGTGSSYLDFSHAWDNATTHLENLSNPRTVTGALRGDDQTPGRDITEDGGIRNLKWERSYGGHRRDGGEGFKSMRLGREIPDSPNNRNTTAAKHADGDKPDDTTVSFETPVKDQGSATLQTGSNAVNEHFPGNGGELYDRLADNGWAFFGVNQAGHAGEVIAPDRVTANTKMRAIEKGLSTAPSDTKGIGNRDDDNLPPTMPEKVLTDAIEIVHKNAYRALTKNKKGDRTLAEFMADKSRHIEPRELDIMDEKHWAGIKEAMANNGMPVHELTLAGGTKGHDGIVRKNAPGSKSASTQDQAHKNTETWLGNILGLGEMVDRGDGKGEVEVTREMIWDDLANPGGWLGAIPPEEERRDNASSYTDIKRGMGGHLNQTARGIKKWSIYNYTTEGAKNNPHYANGRGGRGPSPDTGFLTAEDRALMDHEETLLLLEEFDSELTELSEIKRMVDDLKVSRDDQQKFWKEWQKIAERLDKLTRPDDDEGGLSSRRGGLDDPNDPNDWREIQAELASWREGLGDPRRGSGDDQPRMVRQVRSDGTYEDVVDPDWEPPDDGPTSIYEQDPDEWNEMQEEIRDAMDQRIEESLNRMTDEMRQEEYTRGNELEEAGRQALEDIEWARNEGFRSFINRDPDNPIPAEEFSDPIVRNERLNEAIFNDRMSPMTFDQVADKYGMDRLEVRRREVEHMDLLSGQERYNAQPNLNKRIYEDRVRNRMSLEEAAEKYDMDRSEVRMREVTHANALSGQDKHDAQPNLNRRIAEARMRGMSLDEAGQRFNMDPEEVRSREVTHFRAPDDGPPRKVRQMRSDGTFEDVTPDPDLDFDPDDRGLRSVRAPEAPEAPEEEPKVDQAKVNSLNSQIDSLRDQQIKPLFERIAAAQEEGDTRAVHRLRKQARPLQEEEAELREQLGEAMGKGRVAKFGWRSTRTTDDWDAEWAAAREEAENTLAELAEQIGAERGKDKPDKKKINELAQQQLAAIEQARDRGLRSTRQGAPWLDPDTRLARRRADERFWSEGGEITDTERRTVSPGRLAPQREPSRARMRTATTERAARPLGLASRRRRDDDTMLTVPTLYSRKEGPRQAGTNDGEIWDSLTDDAGVMSPAHAKAITEAVDQLEVELMVGRSDKRSIADTFDGGIMGGNLRAHQPYEDLFSDVVAEAMADGGHIAKGDPAPPMIEWNLATMGEDANEAVRVLENIIQVQMLELTGGKVGKRITTKRRQLDSLQVLHQMKRSGNYEALEQLHPEARRRLLEIARSKDQTFPEKIKGVTASGRGGKNSTVWKAISGEDSVEDYSAAVKRRSRRFREKPSGSVGSDARPLRQRGAEAIERLGTSILAPGAVAAWRRRQEAAARRRAAQAGGGGAAARPKKVVNPWDARLDREERKELKKAKKAAKKLGRLTGRERLDRIREKRTTGIRDTDRPIGGAGASTAFAGTVDDLQQWERAEGTLIVDAAFIDRLAFLTKVRRGEEKRDLKRNKGKGSGYTSAPKGGRSIRDEVLDASWFHAGHSATPELVTAEELQEIAFEPDPDNPGAFRLREGYKPIQRGMGHGKNGEEGEVYWEQWTTLVQRYVPGAGGEGHAAGENHAEPPVMVGGSSKDKGNLYGGYGKGALSFITPETRLVGWRKLTDIHDEATIITKTLSGAGLIDTEAPGSIKNDPDNFSTAVRAALDTAEKAGRLTVPKRKDDRNPQDPNNPSPSTATGTGFSINNKTSESRPMGATWRETEFGSIVDQVLDLHDSGDLDSKQVELAWNFLGGLSESVGDNEHFLFDTMPIYGYDAVQRHGGVISVSNRSALAVLDHPVDGVEATAIIEELAKQGKLDQARLRELIPGYGDFR